MSAPYIKKRLRVWIGSAERLSAPSPDEIGAREKNVSPARSIERALRGSASKRPWLRGLDLNQRPSGYENGASHRGSLILRDLAPRPVPRLLSQVCPRHSCGFATLSGPEAGWPVAVVEHSVLAIYGVHASVCTARLWRDRSPLRP